MPRRERDEWAHVTSSRVEITVRVDNGCRDGWTNDIVRLHLTLQGLGEETGRRRKGV
ncbi:MAG: hypothetical protein HY360_18445 [Verrucomicrobia bacterium]|nr:hypothetical protein [Verrucomicrobiota bacterium]